MATHLLSLLLLVSAQSSPVEVLDLTAPVPPESANRAGCPTFTLSRADMTGAPPRTMPLKLTLIGPERKAYRLDEVIIFEVLIENMGNSSYIIPWAGESDAQTVQPDPCVEPPGFRLFFLRLASERRDALPETISGPSLYGSELHPGSLKELQPGQSVKIRASGHLAFGSSEQGRQWLAGTQFPVTLNLAARLSAIKGFAPSSSPDPVTSSNSLEITISKLGQKRR